MVTNNSANIKTGTSGKILQGQGVGTAPDYSTATYPSTATSTGTILRADGTNWSATTSTYPNTNAVNTLLYASSANVMAALATANSGVLTTDSSGVPSIDTTNFVRQTTGMQVKGNNTNTAPPAGFIGERISSGAVSFGAMTNTTVNNVTSISLTAGIWDITGSVDFSITSAVQSEMVVGISSASATLQGSFGDQKARSNATQGGCTPCVANFRVLLSSTTTYYLIGQANFSAGTVSSTGARLSAVRVG